MVKLYRKVLKKAASPLKGDSIPPVLFWIMAPVVILILSGIVRLGLYVFVFVIFYFIGTVSDDVANTVAIFILVVSLVGSTWAVVDLWRELRK